MLPLMNGAHPRKERGAVIVEFAIVLPILLFMMLATAEFGRAFFQYNTLTKAVRDGARYAAANALAGSLGTLDVNAITTETQQLVVYGNAGGAGMALLPNLAPADVTVTNPSGDLVVVQASYTYTPIFAPSLATFGLATSPNLGFAMQASVVMRAI